MIVCWDVEMVICWNVENVFWCWLIVFIFEVFRWDCMCYVRYKNDFWSKCWWLMLFLKKFDQMNVYESRSTVPNDVKKWSNECDAAIELWADKLLILMSKMLHSIVKRLDALTVVWLSGLHLMPMSSNALTIVSCQKNCTRPHRDQMTDSWCPNCCIRSRWN